MIMWDHANVQAGSWRSNLYDTDSILDSFFNQCYAAGPNRCAIFSPHGADASRETFKEVLDYIYQVPLSVPATGKYGPDLLTWSDVINYILVDSLYKPQQRFVTLARIIHQLSVGNGTELAAMKQDEHKSFCRTPICAANPYSEACQNPNDSFFRSEASAAILCTDAPATLLDWTAIEHYKKWKFLSGQSYLFAAYWAEITMYCSAWNLRPSWNFSNPEISSNNTASPILFVSNTRDPVTPLMNARTMMTKFNGSGLLVQDADGHCSMSAPGTCVAESIRRYFQSGEIPEDGLICRPDRIPFEDGADTASPADVELFEAVSSLAMMPRVKGGPLLHL
jgi:hypothetical protein